MGRARAGERNHSRKDSDEILVHFQRADQSRRGRGRRVTVVLPLVLLRAAGDLLVFLRSGDMLMLQVRGFIAFTSGSFDVRG